MLIENLINHNQRIEYRLKKYTDAFFFLSLCTLMPLTETQMFGSPSTPVLENPEYQTRWYFKYFLGKREYRNPLLCFILFFSSFATTSFGITLLTFVGKVYT